MLLDPSARNWNPYPRANAERRALDERIRGRPPEPAGGREPGVRQTAEPLLHRLESPGVRPGQRYRQYPLGGPRAEAASLIPSAHPPVRGLQDLGGPAAGGVRGRPGLRFLRLIRYPEDGAPQGRGPARRSPRRILAHARRRP